MKITFEDYLKNIYSIKHAAGKVTTTLLAEKLKVSPAAVSDMINKLDKSGYITNTPYKGFELTHKGELIALNLLRKHRLWEVFLLKYLKFPWDKVHIEAENLEHASSDDLIAKLEDFLGFPKYDPHGYPIPDKHGKIHSDKSFPLSDAQTGDNVVVKRVSDESSELLSYLTHIGIKLNDKVKVLDKMHFDNSISIQNKSDKIFLSEKLTKSIFVIKQ